MSGYNGYSMSNNATDAYSRGLLPAGKMAANLKKKFSRTLIEIYEKREKIKKFLRLEREYKKLRKAMVEAGRNSLVSNGRAWITLDWVRPGDELYNEGMRAALALSDDEYRRITHA